jgi:type II secretory pathway component PulF
MQATHAENWRAMIERISNWIPLLGKAQRKLAIARLSIALEALLNAGVTVIESWEIAAAASGSPALRRVVAKSRNDLLSGKTPGEMVRMNSEFPNAFAALYQSGEISGTLDDSLRRSHIMFEEDGSRQMKQFVFGLAGVLFGCVMLYAAWSIIMFYVGYFKGMGNLLDGKF